MLSNTTSVIPAVQENSPHQEEESVVSATEVAHHEEGLKLIEVIQGVVEVLVEEQDQEELDE